MRRLTIILLFVVGAVNAQQYSLPTQINRNRMYVNPAYAGSYEASVASLMHRSQWINVPGALSFQNFEFHTPLKKQAIALGFQVRNESIGLKNNTEAFITYAHRIQLEKSTLAFALKGGAQSLSFKDPRLYEDEVDNAFLSNSTLLPNAGFGVSYYSAAYYFGLSVPYFFGVISPDGNSQVDFSVDRLNFVLSGGGSVRMSDDFKLEPVGAVTYSTTLKPQATLIINVRYLDSFVLGGGYRLNEGIIANAEYHMSKQFSIGYSYDYSLGDIGAFSSGSHELGLLYYFGYKLNTISPRDF
jgi:type IX secretion system PorP/SprF family membrane protein